MSGGHGDIERTATVKPQPGERLVEYISVRIQLVKMYVIEGLPMAKYTCIKVSFPTLNIHIRTISVAMPVTPTPYIILNLNRKHI